MSDTQTIERIWQAPIELVWELWTTPSGLASWWGPGGFQVTVDEMDLRTGGHFSYTMRAVSPEMIEMMKERGRPSSHSVTATFTVVEPPHKLTWDSPFGPETMTTAVVFTQVAEGVKMVLTLSGTKPGMVAGPVMGWKSSLGRFEQRLAQG